MCHLQATFGRQFRYAWDAARQAERPDRRGVEAPWLQTIPCKFGTIFPWGDRLLAAYCHAGAVKRRRRYPASRSSRVVPTAPRSSWRSMSPASIWWRRSCGPGGGAGTRPRPGPDSRSSWRGSRPSRARSVETDVEIYAESGPEPSAMTDADSGGQSVAETRENPCEEQASRGVGGAIDCAYGLRVVAGAHGRQRGPQVASSQGSASGRVRGQL